MKREYDYRRQQEDGKANEDIEDGMKVPESFLSKLLVEKHDCK